jgi:mRNA-degrading endonuclease YafQ of YafQ-DinJ toxin-antitoxin module
MIEILYTKKFLRQFKKLEPALQDVAIQCENIFRISPYDRQLATHKLSGNLSRYWSFSISRSHRIIFRFLEEGDDTTVVFVAIGDHDIYKKI